MTDPSSIPEHVIDVPYDAHYIVRPERERIAHAIAAALAALFTDEPVRVAVSTHAPADAAYEREVRPSSVLAAVLDRDDEGREDTGDERFGAGICVTGRCVEPCGEHGGCKR